MHKVTNLAMKRDSETDTSGTDTEESTDQTLTIRSAANGWILEVDTDATQAMLVFTELRELLDRIKRELS